MVNVYDESYIFYNMKNIEYLGIENGKTNDIFNTELKGKYGLNDKDNLMVCQSEKIITNSNDNCCYYDINNHECGCFNYISLSYSKNVEYENGFNFNKYNENEIKIFLFI